MKIKKVTHIYGTTAKFNHKEFSDLLVDLRTQSLRGLVLFHGVPWSELCNMATGALEEVAANYNGDVGLYTVYVGPQDKWFETKNNYTRVNPFITTEPYLQTVPTLALYVGNPEMAVMVDKRIVPNQHPDLWNMQIKIIQDMLDGSALY